MFKRLIPFVQQRKSLEWNTVNYFHEIKIKHHVKSYKRNKITNFK